MSAAPAKGQIVNLNQLQGDSVIGILLPKCNSEYNFKDCVNDISPNPAKRGSSGVVEMHYDHFKPRGWGVRGGGVGGGGGWCTGTENIPLASGLKQQR